MTNDHSGLPYRQLQVELWPIVACSWSAIRAWTATPRSHAAFWRHRCAVQQDDPRYWRRRRTAPRTACRNPAGETYDTAQLGGLSSFLTSNLVPRGSRTRLWRSWGASYAMLPVGGSAVWGNASWAPDDTPDMRAAGRTYGWVRRTYRGKVPVARRAWREGGYQRSPVEGSVRGGGQDVWVGPGGQLRPCLSKPTCTVPAGHSPPCAPMQPASHPLGWRSFLSRLVDCDEGGLW